MTSSSPVGSPTSRGSAAPEAPTLTGSGPLLASSDGVTLALTTSSSSPTSTPTMGSPTTSNNPPSSVVLAIYQGGYIDGVERNLGVMRKFLSQCTQPGAATPLTFTTSPASSPTSQSSPGLPPMIKTLPSSPSSEALSAIMSNSNITNNGLASSPSGVTLSVPSSSPTHVRSPSRSHVRTPSRVPLDAVTSLLSEPTLASEHGRTEARPDIVVFPELFLTGYVGGEDRVVAQAQWTDGPAFRLISSMAKEFKVAIVFGYPERAGTKVYNSVMMIGRDGSQLLNYRKTHLYGDYESKLFTPGTTLPPVIDYLGVKVSLLICYDIEYVEPARCLALAGCELLIVVTANTNVRNNLITIPARAMDNLIHVAYVNRTVPELCPTLSREIAFNGDSTIAAPDGSLLLQLPHAKQGWGIARITPRSPLWSSTYESNLGLYNGRRPDLYRSIIDAPIKLPSVLADLPLRPSPSSPPNVAASTAPV